MPTLAERSEDILVLAEHFLMELSDRMRLPDLKLHKKCQPYLLNYSWPGNVRELINVMERAAIFSQGKTIHAKHLPPEILNPDSKVHQAEISHPKSLKDVETVHIKRTLAYTDGNRPRAAKILGISQSTLWRKIREFDNIGEEG